MSTSTIDVLRAARKLLTIALACVGVAALLNWFVLPKLRAENRPPDYVKETISPDGKMKAVLFTVSGGAVGASYCFNRLAVIPANVKSEDAVAPHYEVYRADCGYFISDGPSPKVDWASGSLLRITESLSETGLYPRIISIKGGDETRTVKIELSALLPTPSRP